MGQLKITENQYQLQNQAWFSPNQTNSTNQPTLTKSELLKKETNLRPPQHKDAKTHIKLQSWNHNLPKQTNNNNNKTTNETNPPKKLNSEIRSHWF